MTFKRIALNVWRYGRSPALILTAYRAIRDYRCVSRSKFFDRSWIERQYVGLRQSGADPVYACLVSGADPSRDFCCREYLDLHGLEGAGINALVHYERVGKYKGYAISYLDQKAHGGAREGISDHLKLDSAYVAAVHKCALRRIRAKRAAGRPIRVVFAVFNASMFPARPLLDEMLADGMYEPRIAVIPDMTFSMDPYEGMRHCKEKLLKTYSEKFFLETANGEDYADCFDGADITCLATPYDCSNFKYHVRWSLYHEALSIYFNYSYVVTKFSIEVFKQANFSFFWKVFFENEVTLNDYNCVSLCSGSNSALVGYIKMDAFRQAQSDAIVQTRRRMLIVAPHHSFKGGHNDYLLISNFLEYSEYFQELPKRFPEIDFVFRPHPHFRSALSKGSVWGKVRTDEYFARLLANPNVSLSIDDDYFDLFSRSDGLIQDCGSFLAEYFYTNKPQCYLLRSQEDARRAFTSVGLSCLDHCYNAFSKEDVDWYITNVILAGKDPMKRDRELFSRELKLNYPHVASKVLSSLAESL